MEEVLEKALKNYVSSNDSLAKKLWEKLVRKLRLTESQSSFFYHYKGPKMRKATKLISDRISRASKEHGVEEFIIVDDLGVKLYDAIELWTREVLYGRRLWLDRYLRASVSCGRGLTGLHFYTYEALAGALLELETKNVARKLLSLFGQELEEAKTEEEVQSVLEKHPDLLEKLYVEENDAFKDFVDAVKELEDRVASALERFNVDALAKRIKEEIRKSREEDEEEEEEEEKARKRRSKR